MRFACFPAHVSEVLRLPQKSDARSHKVLHLSHKIIFPKLKIWCSKMQPLSENQRPDLLTSLMNMSLVLRLPRKMHLSRSSSNALRLPLILEVLENLHVLLTFDQLHNPSRWPHETTSELQKCPVPVIFLHFWLHFSTSQLPKVLRPWCVLYVLTWKRALRHNWQRRALFRHLNFQKCSGPGVFCTFWLGIVLRATMVCTFSTSQLPNVAQTWGAVYILTSKCASRQNGMQLFISHLATWLRTRRFSEPTLRPSGATNHWKNTVFRDFATFSRTCIFFLLTLSLIWSSLFCSSVLWLFPPLLFHLSILSEVWLLNFLRLTSSISWRLSQHPTSSIIGASRRFLHCWLWLSLALWTGLGPKKMESAGSNLHLSYTTHTHRNITLKRILWNHALYMGDMRWVMSATKYKG